MSTKFIKYFFLYWIIDTCELRWSIFLLCLLKEQKMKMTFLVRIWLSTYYWPLTKKISGVICILKHSQTLLYHQCFFLSCSSIIHYPFQQLEYTVQLSWAYFPVFLHSLNSQLPRTTLNGWSSSFIIQLFKRLVTDMSKLPLHSISKYDSTLLDK